MTYNTIKTMLASVIPAAVLAQEVQEYTITGVSSVQGVVFDVDVADAIQFSWTGEYDPARPDAHYKVLDYSGEGPKPYTVTNTEYCDGTDVIAECTWSYLV